LPEHPSEVRIHGRTPRPVSPEQHVQSVTSTAQRLLSLAKLSQSHRQQADTALLVHIKQSFDDSHGINGSPRVHRDLREVGMHCGLKRVARLMHQAQLRSVRGYKRPRYKAGRPASTAPNLLQRHFTFERPDQAWVTDITYIRTYEG
jgi:putative transposase